MSEELLAAIHANLDDDGPRLVYADQLQDAGDPRGEFIAVQCELARCGYAVKSPAWDWIGDALADPTVAPEHIRKLRAREKALLDEHAEAWLAGARQANPKASLQWLRFERGFIAHTSTSAAADLPDRLTMLLAHVPTIQSLEVSSIHREEVAEAFAWSGFSQLTALAMPASGLRALVPAHPAAKLRDLNLHALDVQEVRALFDWPVFPHIRALELRGPKVTPADAKTLVASCGELEELQLRSAILGAAGAATLAQAKPLAKLRILSLLGNAIGPEGTRAIATLSSLRALDLRKNKIGVVGAAALANHPGLRTLDLTGNSLGEAGIAALCDGRGLTELRELCLQQTMIDDAAVAILAESELLSRVTTLSLRSNKLTDVGAKALASSEHARNLRGLNLNNNKLTTAGKQALDRSPHLEKCRIHAR